MYIYIKHRRETKKNISPRPPLLLFSNVLYRLYLFVICFAVVSLSFDMLIKCGLFFLFKLKLNVNNHS